MQGIWIRRLFAGGIAAQPSTVAHAQSCPRQPVTMIVPLPPGGGTDTDRARCSKIIVEKDSKLE